MKRRFYIIIHIFAVLCLSVPAMAQSRNSLVLDQESFKAVYDAANPLDGVTIDPIGKDRSNRPCTRIKIHVSRMTADDIDLLEVKPVGGNIVVMKKITAHGKNGIIVEMTANPQLRFYLHHPRLGDSDVVSVNASGGNEYLMEAYCQGLQSVMFSSNVKGAKVYLDEEYKGVLDDTGSLPVVGIPIGPHKLKMVYYSQEVTKDIEVSDLSFYFRVDLYEVLMCNILSEPSGAEVFLDGKSIGKTPFYNYPVTATAHMFRAVRDGVEDVKALDVSGLNSDIVFDVQPYVPVSIAVNNAGQAASVSIDGGEWQNAPFKGNLNVGTHKFSIRGYAGNIESHTQQVVKGADNSFSYEWPGAGAYKNDRFWSDLYHDLFLSYGYVTLMPVMTFNSGYSCGYGGIVSVNTDEFLIDYLDFFDIMESSSIYVKYTSTFNANKFKNFNQPHDIDRYTWDNAPGVKELNTTSITAGVMFEFGALAPFIGLGYGKRTHYNTIGNSLYTTPDMKYESCDMDLGLLCNLGRFKLMASITFPGANVGYPLYNVVNHSWDYLRWGVQGAWRFTCWYCSLGPLFDLINLAAGEDLSGYSEVLDIIAPWAPNPIEKSKARGWEWFPYNFVELNLGIGIAF